MQWPFSQRVSSGAALTVFGIGAGSVVGLMSVFATLQGTRPGYCWWWPNAWMALPAAVTVLGLALLAVPVRRGSSSEQTPGADRGSAVVHNQVSGIARDVVQAGRDVHIYQGPQSGSRSGRERSDYDASPALGAYGIGEGLPGWVGQFERAFNELKLHGMPQVDGTNRPISILGPRDKLYSEGPGVVQDFNSLDSSYGWVLCALPNQRVVAVDGEIWNELLALGPSTAAGHPLEALGYPVPSVDSTRCIERTATRVDLAGGAWRGYIVRDGDSQPWRWEPIPRPSTEAIREKEYWSNDVGQRLRMRLVAVMPWINADDLEITPQRRNAFETGLADSAITSYLVQLLTRPGAVGPAASWTTGSHPNTTDRLSYVLMIKTPEGAPALSAEIMMGLPDANSRSVVACVQASVHDFDAWRELIPNSDPGQDLRVSTVEAAEFFAAATQAAASTLLSALGEPLPSRYFSQPKLQLVLATDRPRHDQPYPPLDQYVDLAPLGRGDDRQVIELSVSTTATPAADVEAQGGVTRAALVHAAGRFGFIDATEQAFLRNHG